jgi:hypothetical protein
VAAGDDGPWMHENDRFGDDDFLMVRKKEPRDGEDYGEG